MSTHSIKIEDDIVWRLKKNDTSALTELYNIYWEQLFLYAYNVLRNKELCEDLVQEIFISIWQNRHNLKINSSLKAYLYASTRYQVFGRMKKNKDILHTELWENIDKRVQQYTPETELMYKELVQQMNSVVERLPEKCRLVFRLSREEQLSHKEISNRLNISPKTVENHITKALFTLRTEMGALFPLVMLIWTS